jgi:hypothetical protein
MLTNSSALKTVSLIFLIIILISMVKSKIAMIEVYNSLMKVDVYYTGFWEDSVKEDEFSQEDILNYSGKICTMDTKEKIMKDCFIRYENYNYEWVRRFF